jgi:methylmalonyl-CoA mutase cobalamin-binding subunit
MPFEERARGPVVVLATLPGEEHALGLQMAALVLAWCGCRIVYLGAQAPVDELAQLARDLGARAVAVSVSIATAGKATNAMLGRVRRRLPKRAALVVGGQGAPKPRPGLEITRDLRALESWAREILRA